ncbi:right-handed parallel beta-helix repeat-containing protein [Candidatus Micrarchaeota archaeon]|nr:right-handed parallel beta-helix repeat-containing protein [Candidatus Micrarchaeota archaeon]
MKTILFVLALIVGLSFAVQPIAVSKCTNLTVPGVYQLTQDISGVPNDAPEMGLEAAACMKISSSSVTLDCNGYSIIGPNVIASNKLYGILINNSVNSVSVLNCKISGYTYGIYALKSTSGTFSENILLSNTKSGFYSTEGVQNSITKNYAYSNGDHGFSFYYERDSTVSHNNASSNKISGFSLDGSSERNIFANDVSYINNQDGFVVYNSPNNAFDSAFSHDNDRYGLLILSSPGTNISHSTFYKQSNGAVYTKNSDINFVRNHFYSNSPDIFIDNGPAPYKLSLAQDIFDNQNGNYANYLTLSAYDVVQPNEAYKISWAQLPLPLPNNRIAFDNASFSLTSVTGNPAIENLNISWSGSHFDQATYSAQNFSLYRYDNIGNGGWSGMTNPPNIIDQKFSLSNVNSFGTYAILQSIPPQPPQQPQNLPNLSIDAALSCNGNVVKVTSNNAPLLGAVVSVTRDGQQLFSGAVNEFGEFTFSDCGRTVTITATANGYNSQSIQKTLVSCNQCNQPNNNCNSNNDCADDQRCRDTLCRPVICDCGVVQKHQCIPYACCLDSDCGPGGVCAQNICTYILPSPPPEQNISGNNSNETIVPLICESAGDCPLGQSCDQQSKTCKSVTNPPSTPPANSAQNVQDNALTYVLGGIVVVLLGAVGYLLYKKKDEEPKAK